MRDPEPFGDRARVGNVLASTAAARAADRRAMIVKLERDADRLGAARRRQGGHDRAVDAARHGDDDAAACARIFSELKQVFHDAGFLADPLRFGKVPERISCKAT